MATESVATAGSTHGLWISDKTVLTVAVDRKSNEFPPHWEQCKSINQMIQGLARAANAVVYHAENDEQTDTFFALQPINDIANAIILLSQLSEAVTDELNRRGEA